MRTDFIFDFILGVLLAFTLVRVCDYLWFMPSPFNMDLIGELYDKANLSRDFFRFCLYRIAVIVVSLIFQLLIPFGVVSLKILLTFHISFEDCLLIISTPALILLLSRFQSLWCHFNGGEYREFEIYPGCEEKEDYKERLKSNVEKLYDDVSLIETDNPKKYKFQFKTKPSNHFELGCLLEDILIPVGALFFLCLAGGELALALYSRYINFLSQFNLGL